MRITVFGASGKVGSLVVEEALRQGYEVVAFVHNHDLFAPSGKLTIIKGDIYKEQEVIKAVTGSQAIISCLGSWGTPKKNVLTTAMRTIIPAMGYQHIERIVTLTGSGAASPSKRPSSLHRTFLKLLHPFPVGKVFADGEEHMRLLNKSDLKWTSLRSPVMTNGGRKGYYLDLKAGSNLATIRRSTVAEALLEQLKSEQYVRQAPVIHRV